MGRGVGVARSGGCAGAARSCEYNDRARFDGLTEQRVSPAAAVKVEAAIDEFTTSEPLKNFIKSLGAISASFTSRISFVDAKVVSANSTTVGRSFLFCRGGFIGIFDLGLQHELELDNIRKHFCSFLYPHLLIVKLSDVFIYADRLVILPKFSLPFSIALPTAPPAERLRADERGIKRHA